MNDLDKALIYMLHLIALGFEYPDAQWKASSRFNVDHEELAREYDRHGVDGD